MIFGKLASMKSDPIPVNIAPERSVNQPSVPSIVHDQAGKEIG